MLARRAIATGIFGQIPLNRQIANLFRNGEQGAWYDPSDWSTLFQDSAGTTPVTAVGQPVGLMLDKRITTSNLVVVANTLGTGAWSTAPGSGTITGGVWSGMAQYSTIALSQTLIIGKTYRVVGAGSATGSAAFYSLPGASYGGFSSTFCLYFTATHQTLVLQANSAGMTISLSAFAIHEAFGNHATQPTAINRPVLQIDGNGKYYLAFNGTNSWMSTSAINFTATDKMTVVAGYQRLTNSADQIILEAGPSVWGANPGSFAVFSTLSSQAKSAVFLRGQQHAGISFSVLSLAQYVMVAKLDIAGASRAEEISARLNSQTNGILGDAANAGTGNFGNWPLYIGARAGSQYWLNGQVYGLVIRGAQSSDSQIAAAEKFINQKTGAW